MNVAITVSKLFKSNTPIKFLAYDNSVAGDLNSINSLNFKSKEALQYIATSPNDLGLARAYVTGQLDVEGDLHKALLDLYWNLKTPIAKSVIWSIVKELGLKILKRPPVPVEEAPSRYKRGVLHSLKRDASAIEHHYDVSNEFYRLILGETMVYSCAVFNSKDATLEQAQNEKIDLICRKLGLKPGMKLLDIGCGWGSLIIHAAKNYGVKAIGVTLSKQQLSLATQRVKDQNLTDQVEIRLQDYREVPERDFDAISSVGMSEHVGDEKLDAYFAKLKTYVKDGGMILNHCIVRPTSKEPAQAGAFIDRYIFPDGELTAASRVSQAMIDNSIELRHSENLREHYAMTLNKWCQNLKQNWQEAVKIVGEQRARIWLLYMTVSQIGFEINNIQIHQFLGVVNHADGSNQLPLRQYW